VIRRGALASALPVVVLLAGCGVPHGQPHPASVPLAPNEVVEFEPLYADNCAGCHGAHGRGGAAISLANPVYLAIADDRSLQAVIAGGVPGTSMPAFAQRAGGMLTEKQIDALVEGLRSRSSLAALENPPSYAAASAGDINRGALVYQTFCKPCHGENGEGGPKASAITNDSFLALTSDQALRTMVIAGRPELGAPDWRGTTGTRPLSEQEVTDVVSWLASHRVAAPGQPYRAAQSASGASRAE
jgi:mono/diheme cytochrome c family protein